MKHGVAFRKFSRTSSHRMLMLRNLVTSLIEHEQIKTTLPKAKDAARLAEKLITMGKKGGLPMYQRANAFLLKPQLTPKVFGKLAERYGDRAGGYTRIHKYGSRPGDNAPQAILELVDNPRDLKFEMTARAVGWDLLGKRLAATNPRTLANEGVPDLGEAVDKELRLGAYSKGELRPKTRWNMQKVLKFRSVDAITDLKGKARDHLDTLLAQPIALKKLSESKDGNADKAASAGSVTSRAFRLRAGQTLPGGARSSLRLARGALGDEPSREYRPFSRMKLGVDRTSLWSKL